MNTPETTSQTVPEEQPSLAEEVRLLRKYLVVALIAMVVVTFCFNVFLYRLDRSTRGQIAQAQQLERTVGASLGKFLSQVVNFSTTHPDVAEILAKYGKKAAPTSAPGAALTNRPSPAPRSGGPPNAPAPGR